MEVSTSEQKGDNESRENQGPSIIRTSLSGIRTKNKDTESQEDRDPGREEESKEIVASQIGELALIDGACYEV